MNKMEPVDHPNILAWDPQEVHTNEPVKLPDQMRESPSQLIHSSANTSGGGGNTNKQQPAKPSSLISLDSSSSFGSYSGALNRIQLDKVARKQHTLDSIEGEQSRSRSPIVQQRSTRLPRTTDHRFLATNPFEWHTSHATAGNTTGKSSRRLSGPTPVERISLQSFQRRRSAYETSNGEAYSSKRKRNNSPANSLTSESAQNRRYDTAADDQLSVEQILANIEAGKLASLTPRQLSQEASVAAATAATAQAFEGRLADDFRSSNVDSTASIATSCSSILSLAQTRSNGDETIDGKQTDGFEIVWLNLTYSVEPNIFEDPRWGKINSFFHKEPRMILKGLSGGLRSGQLVALMGPSGAGKTCLLECISGLRLTGIGGKMLIRGQKRVQLNVVPQYDDFMPQFSVEEIIVYGSKMKNSANTDHRAVANQVINQLGLQACRSTNIQRCSGGQRKRVAIAQELVSRPNILILDEPTSGLDSSCCYQTMKVLRDVLDKSVESDRPMAIVTTIHQPPAKVFKMFDLVYLLSKKGYMAYTGPPDDLLPTIRDVTGLECAEYSNPSDYMIELVSYDYGEQPVEELVEFEKEKARRFVRDFESRLRRSSKTQLDNDGDEFAETNFADSHSNLTKPPVVTSIASPCRLLKVSCSETNLAFKHDMQQVALARRLSLASKTKHHIEYKSNVLVSLKKATSSANGRHPFFWHSFVHFHRSILQSIRDPILNNMRILIHLGFATLLVLLYGKKSGEARGCPPVIGLPREITDPDNESMIDLADNVGYLFMCIMMITYVSLMSTVLTFPIDIKTVGKEYKNGWYGTMSYFLGKSVADLPFIVAYPIVYCIITWYMTNQAPGELWRFFSFTALIIINAINSQSFGLILGALFVNSVTAATFLGPIITIPWYLFTGFTKRVHRLASPYKVTSKFLFTRYVFEGILDTVYGHQRCNCSQFLQNYHQLRYMEAVRLGQLISVETLSSLDYYDGLDQVIDAGNMSMFPIKGSAEPANGWLEKTVDAASTVFADGEDLDLASLMGTNVRASELFTFGLDFEPTCPTDYKNFVVQDFRLESNTLERAFTLTLCMLAIIKVLTFLVVAWKIRTRQL